MSYAISCRSQGLCIYCLLHFKQLLSRSCVMLRAPLCLTETLFLAVCKNFGRTRYITMKQLESTIFLEFTTVNLLTESIFLRSKKKWRSPPPSVQISAAVRRYQPHPVVFWPDSFCWGFVCATLIARDFSHFIYQICSGHFWKNDAADAATKNQKKSAEKTGQNCHANSMVWFAGRFLCYCVENNLTSKNRRERERVVTGCLGHLWYPTSVSQYKPEEITWQ